MTRSPAAQRGFTLIEMMVVVAILAILSTLAIVYMRSNTRPVDAATRFANMVQRGSRTAVRLGMVRADVVTTEGSKRRTRIIASGTTRPLFTLEVLVEDATPLWQALDSYQVPLSVTATGFANAVGTYSAVGTLATDWSTFVLNFEPDGSSNSSTLFFESMQGATSDRHARVSVLPLGTATFVLNSWE